MDKQKKAKMKSFFKWGILLFFILATVNSLTRRQNVATGTDRLQNSYSRPSAVVGVGQDDDRDNGFNRFDIRQSSVSSQPSQKSMVGDGRPKFENRLFVSPTVETVIDDVSTRIADPTIRQIFRNCLPSTLDTTVLWHRPPSWESPIPYTYIITGDIAAMWLRDSTYQVNPYVPLARGDAELRDLVLGVINSQAEMLELYPFGNAYFPLKHWHANITLYPPDFGKSDQVYPMYNREEVFEAKYELDSLASFLYLTKYYYEETGNSDFLSNPHWKSATEIVLKTMRDLQLGCLETLYTQPYKFTRLTRTHTETQNMYGIANPVKKCGLIRSFFRPSDDATILPFLIPSNAMAVVGLWGVSEMLEATGKFPDLATDLKSLANEVHNAIMTYGIVQHPKFGPVYAYEVDCYGSHIFMDDANFPSLLSLPKFGYVHKDDVVYLNTRKYILSHQWNPYFTVGKFPGVGSPHTGLQKTWHMSLCMQAMTSTDENEIYNILWKLRNSTAGTGFMHESFDVNNPNSYTRPWFAWANTVFGDLILHLDRDYPHLLQGHSPQSHIRNNS